jgi:hypothetical protein
MADIGRDSNPVAATTRTALRRGLSCNLIPRHSGPGERRPPAMATTLRNVFESLQVLRRYRDFTSELLCAIFEGDIARCEIDTERPNSVWLADVALLGTQPWHRLFALESLFEAATQPRDFRRIRELGGTLDIFGLKGLDEPQGTELAP